MQMNDRYLYRAKRTDNGKWAEGSHVYTFTEDKDCPCAGIYKKNHWIVDENGNMVSIDPSTICQCTGLNDKNGELIWENDILVGYLDTELPDDTTYITVLWHDAGFYCKENDYFEYLPLEEFHHKYFKVCGNIFDNSELLEVEE